MLPVFAWCLELNGFCVQETSIIARPYKAESNGKKKKKGPIGDKIKNEFTVEQFLVFPMVMPMQLTTAIQ